MLRSILLYTSILSSSLAITLPLNPAQASPTEGSPQQHQQKATSPYATMTQHQLNQVKRYDCRLPKELLPHDYQTKEEPTTAATVKKNTSKLKEKVL